MPGKTKIIETGRATTILLDADTARVAVGGDVLDGAMEVITAGRSVGAFKAEHEPEGQDPLPRRQPPGGGVLELCNHDGEPQIVLHGGTGSVRARVLSAETENGLVGVRLNGEEAVVTIGGERSGSLVVMDHQGLPVVEMDRNAMRLGTAARHLVPEGPPATNGYGLSLYDHVGRATAVLSGPANHLELGHPHDGGHRKVRLDGQSGTLKLGLPRGHVDGMVNEGGDGQRSVELDGENGRLSLGRFARAGRITIRDAENRAAVNIDGEHAAMTLGAHGREGDLIVADAEGRVVCHIDGATARLRLGIEGSGGDLRIHDSDGREVMRANAETAALRVGTNGNSGEFLVRDGAGRVVVQLDGEAAQIGIGSSGHAGRMQVRSSGGIDTIRLDGESGDILLSNADCAEEFDFTHLVEPGTVVVINDDEQLAVSMRAYDTRVAGVVSGAGRYRPAIVLDRRSGQSRPAVAMVGKVECRVDARHGRIRCGDLLVSSPTPGYAMAAQDRARMAGAVLGKALRALDGGQGLIPILVCLQ